MGRLTDKYTLITGGTSGIGLATAQAFIAEGARVAVTGRNPDTLAEAERILGDKAWVIPTDAGDIASQKALAETLAARWPRLDAVFLNAGDVTHAPLEAWQEEAWDRLMNINLKAVFHLSQLFVNHCLAKDRAGSILNITSQAAFHGSTTGHAHYAASKAGLVAFAISLAREVAKQKINVNNIAVGIMDTAMIRKNIEQNPDYYVSRIPVGRVAQPHEIADIGVFMVSPKTSYMTGATLDVTGGMLMR